MTCFIAFSALKTSSAAFLSNMTKLIASKAGSSCAIVMTMITQTVHTFLFYLHLQTIFSNMSFLAASETFYSSYLILLLLKIVKISRIFLSLLRFSRLVRFLWFLWFVVLCVVFVYIDRLFLLLKLFWFDHFVDSFVQIRVADVFSR